MAAPRISVVIHFLNAKAYLPEAVASVRAQTFTDWELILVDGGSEDGTAELAQEIAAQEPGRIRTLLHPRPGRLGIFSSRAWGAREARAPLVGLLDSDDLWHPRFLERQEALYRATLGERPGMVCCPAVYYWDDPIENLRSYVQPMAAAGLHAPPEILHSFFDEGYARSAANSATLIARECLLDAAALIGRAHEGAVEDQYLWGHVGLRHPIVINPEPLVWYRQWPGSTCAVQVKKEQDVRAIRRAQLLWLKETLENDCPEPSRSGKDALLARTEAWLRELDHPPGPLARKLRQWKAGLARRLA